MAKMTAKQKRFCDEYLIDLNATQAAIRAGYSEKTAAEQGARLLVNVKVQTYIQKRKSDRERRTEITQDRVLNELAAIAFSNGANYSKIVKKRTYDELGNEVEYSDVEFKDTDELTAEQKKAISAIKQTKFGIAVETCDKVKALELLGKHLGMFTENIEVNGQINNPMADLTTEELKKLIESE